MTLGADTGYASGTGYEYAKVLMYALEWLAQEPVSLMTHEPIGHSLLALGQADLRALFAWPDIPARQKTARAHLIKTGELPAGYRAMSLVPSTRNLRAAALFTFYEWIIAEYVPADGGRISLTENPLTHPRSKRRLRQEMVRPDGLLPHTPHADGDPNDNFAVTILPLVLLHSALPNSSSSSMRSLRSAMGAMLRTAMER